MYVRLVYGYWRNDVRAIFELQVKSSAISVRRVLNFARIQFTRRARILSNFSILRRFCEILWLFSQENLMERQKVIYRHSTRSVFTAGNFPAHFPRRKTGNFPIKINFPIINFDGDTSFENRSFVLRAIIYRPLWDEYQITGKMKCCYWLKCFEVLCNQIILERYVG